MLAFAFAVLAAVDLGSLLLGPVIVSAGDLVRLVAVPVLGWAAYRDVQTRRVPNRTWLPLLAVGVLALALDALVVYGPTGSAFLQRALLIRVVVSLVVVGGLGYAFWWVGGFGGADAKALMTLSLLYPTYPSFILRGTDVVLPLVEATLAVFSLTILTNTVVLGVAAPVALAARNAIAGRFTPAMFIGRPIAVADLTEAYGRLLETPDGFTRGGLDVDALRMYLRWRGTTLAALRAAPARHRDPASLPDETNAPGDGSLEESGEHLLADDGRTANRGTGDDAPTDGGTDPATDADPTTDDGPDGDADDADHEDPWGAARFFADLDGDAYGTTPEDLRDGLDVLTEDGREAVWLTPGMPFIVPMFLGLLFALTFGDLLFALLTALGFV